MKIQELFDLAKGRDLKKSYLKSDGYYIWDYKLINQAEKSKAELELIVGTSGKTGFPDKVSLEEIQSYILEEVEDLSTVIVTGAEDLRLAKI